MYNSTSLRGCVQIRYIPRACVVAALRMPGGTFLKYTGQGVIEDL